MPPSNRLRKPAISPSTGRVRQGARIIRRPGAGHFVGPDHVAASNAELRVAVEAVDAWFESGAPSFDLDLSDSSQAAVDAAKARAADLGIVAVQVPGRRVVIRLVASATPPRVND